MHRHRIPERDWKVFRELRALALERFCQRVLAEVAGVSGDESHSFHEGAGAGVNDFRRSRPRAGRPR